MDAALQRVELEVAVGVADDQLAVEDVAPGPRRERGDDLRKLARELAAVPRVEPHLGRHLVELAPDAVVLVLDPERRAEAADRVGKGLQPLGQRRVHVAAAHEGLFEQLRKRLRIHSTVLGPRRMAAGRCS